MVMSCTYTLGSYEKQTTITKYTVYYIMIKRVVLYVNLRNKISVTVVYRLINNGLEF